MPVSRMGASRHPREYWQGRLLGGSSRLRSPSQQELQALVHAHPHALSCAG